MRVAAICIAKFEDDYLDEWIDYHTALGFDDVFVYQNDWRLAPKRRHPNLNLLEADGSCMQLPSYNDFIENRSGGYDFGAFIDADEYICILKGECGIKPFLADAVAKRGRFFGIALNWRVFGDSGRQDASDGDMSVLNRFTRCQEGLNRHVKTIVNFGEYRRADRNVRGLVRFFNPHCLTVSAVFPSVFDSAMERRVAGPFNDGAMIGDAVACVNHYHSKTRQEFRENKMRKGRCDFPYGAAEQDIGWSTFDEHNRNETECTIARDFYNGRRGD